VVDYFKIVSSLSVLNRKNALPMLSLLQAVLGNPNERKVRKLEPLVEEIGRFEVTLQQLSDD
jgi:hypothetical protein